MKPKAPACRASSASMARASEASRRELDRRLGARARASRTGVVSESAVKPEMLRGASESPTKRSRTAAAPCDTLATLLGARRGQPRTAEDNDTFGKPLRTLSLSVLECPGQDIQTWVRGSETHSRRTWNLQPKVRRRSHGRPRERTPREARSPRSRPPWEAGRNGLV